MFETGVLVSAMLWALSMVCLAVSLTRAAFRRWRRSGIRQAALAAGLFWVALAAVILCNQFVYLDYGLTSREGLEKARAQRKSERDAQRVVAEAKAVAERAAAEKAAAEEKARQAEIDAERRKQEAEQREAEKKLAEAAALLKKCGDTTMAFVMSQEFVKRSLKAPSTAKFPWITDDQVSVTTRPGCAFRVVAWVDAQNGFGAQIRSRYVVDLAYLNDKAGTWQLKNIRID